MKLSMKTTDEKFLTIIQKNTFYFFNPAFEEKNEAYLNSVKETLLLLKHEVEGSKLEKAHIAQFIKDKPYGLSAILTLTGLSNEFFKRIITIVRAVDDSDLAKLTNKEKWFNPADVENLSEWSDNKIQGMIQSNEDFRMGIVNIFFEGATIPFLSKTIPLFELKKFSFSKLNFDLAAMIDTLIRYKEKGSYSGNSENNPEAVLADAIESLDLTFEKGDLRELVANAPNQKRTMDFIIPNKKQPRIIIESSFLATTSSGMGDKAKTEIGVASLIKQHYPNAKFIGFIDGVGWYVRKKDLRRMVDAFDDVFTFHETEIKRFEQLLTEEFKPTI
jgi:hypothetical protein